jgi:pimeloyl-ACP methyl ester carboxylesterase
VQGFLEALELRHIDLAAFSFGTTVATTLIREGPVHVDRLALVSPPGLGTTSPESSALPQRSSAAARRSGFRAGVDNTMRELMLCNHQRVTGDLLDMMVEYVGLTKYSTGPISTSYRMLDAMRQIDLPTLVLIGDHDPFQNHELDLRLANVRAALRGVDARIVRRAAHWIQYDQPALVDQILLEFFGPA